MDKIDRIQLGVIYIGNDENVYWIMKKKYSHLFQKELIVGFMN